MIDTTETSSEHKMEKLFGILRAYHGTHQAVADALGVSYSAYNKWKADISTMPEWAANLIRLEADRVMALLSDELKRDKPQGACIDRASGADRPRANGHSKRQRRVTSGKGGPKDDELSTLLVS